MINKHISGKRIEWNRIHKTKLTQLFNEGTLMKENHRQLNIVHYLFIQLKRTIHIAFGIRASDADPNDTFLC